MASDTSLEVAAELAALLPTGSKSLTVLSKLQDALSSQEELGQADDVDYTKSRANALRQLALRMKALVFSSSSLTYSDKAVTLSSVSDSYLKLAHAFKTDPKMWSLAQSELVPTLTQVSTESDIDAALSLLSSHLETYLISLDSWLDK